jgi:hypothetical protein
VDRSNSPRRKLQIQTPYSYTTGAE